MRVIKKEQRSSALGRKRPFLAVRINSDLKNNSSKTPGARRENAKELVAFGDSSYPFAYGRFSCMGSEYRADAAHGVGHTQCEHLRHRHRSFQPHRGDGFRRHRLEA